MFVYRVNINSSLESLVDGNPDGGEKDFIIKEQRKKEIDYLPYFAYQIASDGFLPFIRVKFDWEYGQRPRRIELVGIKNGSFFIYKKSSVFAVDSNALDLWRLKQRIEEKYENISVSCVLIFTEAVNVDSISSTIESLGIDVNIKILI